MPKKTKKNLNKLDNTIDYWRKHQELDKFNINKDTSLYVGHMSLIIALFIGLVGLIQIIFLIWGWIDNFPLHLQILFVFIIIITISIIIYYKRGGWQSKIENHNRSFKIREAMLRVWYQQEEKGVDTDGLDTIFENIKSRYNSNLSNKDIENIAKEFILDNRKS